MRKSQSLRKSGQFRSSRAMSKEELEACRNPFVSQVNSDGPSCAQYVTEWKVLSQSLRKSGQFRYHKVLDAISQGLGISRNPFVSQVNSDRHQLPWTCRRGWLSQSLRKSGQFRSSTLPSIQLWEGTSRNPFVSQVNSDASGRME